MAARLWVASLWNNSSVVIFTYPIQNATCPFSYCIISCCTSAFIYHTIITFSWEQYYLTLFATTSILLLRGFSLVNLISSAWLEHENILTTYFVILWYIKYMTRDRGYGQPQSITSIGWFLVVWLTGFPAIGRYCCIIIIVLYIVTLWVKSS